MVGLPILVETTSMISRRRLLKITALVCGTMIFPMSVSADETIIKVGTLKLIHGIAPYFYGQFAPEGYTVEVVPFESPTDGKNAVLTGTVDVSIHGIAAAFHGAANGEPIMVVANATNKGMAVIAGVDTDIETIKDLKGKRVAIWPGSTQEAVILERLRMEGMSIKDLNVVRLSFSDHPSALTRGDIDAYVGAEPAAGISLANGTGKLVEYPYSSPIGSLNMTLSASKEMVEENPERLQMIVDMHKKAGDYAMAHPEEMVEVAMKVLGQQRPSIEKAIPNVELTWEMDDVFVSRAEAYLASMYENKQIRRLPVLEEHITSAFVK